jgi:glycosyltransferase involved in cell wall biosynthesis
LPRQCKIATFTSDLTDALEEQDAGNACIVLAVNESGCQYHYRDRVRFEISEAESASYRRAADFLNVNAIDVVNLQHEYGIFGGRCGNYVLGWMRELRMPVVTTLHTILPEPTLAQQQVMDEIIQRSSRLIVMTQDGAELLRRVHGVMRDRIDVIPYGIDEIPPGFGSKTRVGVQGKNVIFTFGLLSPDKGIEFVIEALPEILRHFPNTVYVVLGTTHPHVKMRHGETYRLMLESRAVRLGVQNHVIFHDRFVTRQELREFVAVADIYVTPYLNPEQTNSGTLAYALGSGKAVISTPYRYAVELLADGRGRLVPWRSPAAIADSVIALLANPGEHDAMRERAAELGRSMKWPNVAQRYSETFLQAVVEYGSIRTGSGCSVNKSQTVELPEVKLSHLRAMTDSTGLLQHADYDVPCYAEGYCLDDNARALLLSTLLENYGIERTAEIRQLSARYLAFVSYSFDSTTRRFHNHMSYARVWLAQPGSEDCHARALWALGAVIGHSDDPGRQSLAGQIFHSALPPVADFTSPRAWAITLLGIGEYLHAFRGDVAVQSVQLTLAERLMSLYERVSSAEWQWFETTVTYSNARLPQALIVVGRDLQNAHILSIGLEALGWLAQEQTAPNGHFSPIGSNGFWTRGEHKPLYDQQPLEACAMVSACLEAWRTTGNAAWLSEARRAFYWFLGDNHLEASLYDDSTGGCRDGLHEDRANQNQGAESTLAFLLALLEMRAAERPRFSSAPAGVA